MWARVAITLLALSHAFGLHVDSQTQDDFDDLKNKITKDMSSLKAMVDASLGARDLYTTMRCREFAGNDQRKADGMGHRKQLMEFCGLLKAHILRHFEDLGDDALGDESKPSDVGYSTEEKYIIEKNLVETGFDATDKSFKQSTEAKQTQPSVMIINVTWMAQTAKKMRAAALEEADAEKIELLDKAAAQYELAAASTMPEEAVDHYKAAKEFVAALSDYSEPERSAGKSLLQLPVRASLLQRTPPQGDAEFAYRNRKEAAEDYDKMASATSSAKDHWKSAAEAHEKSAEMYKSAMKSMTATAKSALESQAAALEYAADAHRAAAQKLTDSALQSKELAAFEASQGDSSVGSADVDRVKADIQAKKISKQIGIKRDESLRAEVEKMLLRALEVYETYEESPENSTDAAHAGKAFESASHFYDRARYALGKGAGELEKFYKKAADTYVEAAEAHTMVAKSYLSREPTHRFHVMWSTSVAEKLVEAASLSEQAGDAAAHSMMSSGEPAKYFMTASGIFQDAAEELSKAAELLNSALAAYKASADPGAVKAYATAAEAHRATAGARLAEAAATTAKAISIRAGVLGGEAKMPTEMTGSPEVVANRLESYADSVLTDQGSNATLAPNASQTGSDAVADAEETLEPDASQTGLNAVPEEKAIEIVETSETTPTAIKILDMAVKLFEHDPEKVDTAIADELRSEIEAIRPGSAWAVVLGTQFHAGLKTAELYSFTMKFTGYEGRDSLKFVVFREV